MVYRYQSVKDFNTCLGKHWKSKEKIDKIDMIQRLLTTGK